MGYRDVTLAIISTDWTPLDFEALKRSAAQFDAGKVIVLSHSEAEWQGIPIVRIEKFKSFQEYNMFLLYDLHKHVQTPFLLTIQWDGFVLNGSQFSPHFFHYDYIGAPWPWFPHFRVGNGGFAWRSRRLMEAGSKLAAELGVGLDTAGLAEDLFLCRSQRVTLEDRFGIRFCGEDLAYHFAIEMGQTRFPTFGFHGVWHLPHVYADRLDWLLESIPERSVANDVVYGHILRETQKISPAHASALQKRRLALKPA